MSDLEFVLQLVITMAAVTGPVIVGTKLLAGDATPDDADMRWPRGVQEEEPQRWNIQLLERRGTQREPVGPAPQGRQSQLPLSR